MSTYHHGNLREALLSAGGELLEKQGIASLSLRETARLAGVSHAAPYRHFPDRESLLAGLAAEGFGLLGTSLANRPQREMGEGYIEFALAHPQRYRLMFGGLLTFDAHPQLREHAGRSYQVLQEAFQELGAEAPLAAAAAWSMVHGLASLMLDGHFADAQREAGGAAAFAKKVLGSMRAARAQRSA